MKDRTKGEEAIGIIQDIELDELQAFIKPENLKEGANPNAQSLQVTIETPDGNVIRKAMTFSKHPKSNLQKWFKKYKKYPEIGDKVNLEFDGNFWQVEEL